MIGYITIGVKDLDRAKQFYTSLLKDLGVSVLMDMERIAFLGKSMDKPMLAVCIPFDKKDPEPGNGTMMAIPAGDKETVDKLHKAALELGATNEGDPGERIPGQFYGGYIRDLDGNKIVFYVFG